ncbi:unnamed protein product [Fusarium graminearum]|nr:unnamed protein product [Fusarium graminearum]
MSLSASTLKNTSSSPSSSNLTLEPLSHSLSEYLISKHLKTITTFIFPRVTLDYHQHIMFIQGMFITNSNRNLMLTANSDQQTCAAFTDTFSEGMTSSHSHLQWPIWYYVWLEEKELQLLMPIVVLAYWKSLGGRCQTTQFPKYHVLRILEEEKRHYKIQWIGYSEEDFSWETKKKIKDICPWAVLAWKAWNKN